MRIKNILSQHRRDFTAIYICEHCGAERNDYGYDDSYFHNVVIPHMKCEKCGKVAGADYKPLRPRYPDWETV